jgi:hypothetical protein
MVNPAAEPNAPKEKRNFRNVEYWCSLFPYGCGLFILLLLFLGITLGPINPGYRNARASVLLQNTRTIGIAMFQYSNDHNSVYPDGESSTEVFQKLLDEKYISDPTIFYIPLPGKIKPIEGQPLKPENVCFDVTSGVDSMLRTICPSFLRPVTKSTMFPAGAPFHS